MGSPTPLSGGTITALSTLDGKVAVPMASNKYWQELNDRIGGIYEPTLVPDAEYASKFATVVAGDDLPDIATIATGNTPNLPELLEAKFADLTDLLSGDAVAEFPSLANIPPSTWRNTIFNGRIYGIPIHRGNAGSVMLAREDLRASTGATGEVTDADSFVALCEEVTSVKDERWALADPMTTFHFALEMFDAPNEWQVTDGKFTSVYETEQARAALEFMIDLWGRKVIHPEGFVNPDPVNRQQYGVTVLGFLGYNTWQGLARQTADTDARWGAIITPGADGGEVGKHLGNGFYSMTGFRKAEPDRITELLRWADYVAAPFGTSEYLFIRYGIEDRHFTFNGTEPELIVETTDERRLSVPYLSAAPSVLYVPGQQEPTKLGHAYQAETVPKGKPLPTLGLYSATDMSKGRGLSRDIVDTCAEIIQGRKQLSDWDGMVDRWRSNGLDTIRTEYEQALAGSN